MTFKNEDLKLAENSSKAKCDVCGEIKEKYLTDLCKECANKMDEHILWGEDEKEN